jgi:hypothetical protein
MAFYSTSPPRSQPTKPAPSASRPISALRRFSFEDEDGELRVDAGSAVLVTREPTDLGAFTPTPDSEDCPWSDAQTADFLAGAPLTLRWVTQSPAKGGSERVYVCCWVTIGE